MKKYFLPLVFLIAVVIVATIYSCKKDSKSVSLLGTYRITAISEVNSDGSLTPEQLSSCASSNTIIFAANNIYNQTICGDPEAGTYTYVDGTLSTFIGTGKVDAGIVKNLTSTGFTLDENALGFGENDIITFTRQ